MAKGLVDSNRPPTFGALSMAGRDLSRLHDGKKSNKQLLI